MGGHQSKGRRQRMCSPKQKRRPLSSLLFLFLCLSVDATVLLSGDSAARAFSEQLLQKLVVITAVVFFPASKLASCPSAICKLRSAASPPQAACSVCSAAAARPQPGRAGSAADSNSANIAAESDGQSKQLRLRTGTRCHPRTWKPGLVVSGQSSTEVPRQLQSQG